MSIINFPIKIRPKKKDKVAEPKAAVSSRTGYGDWIRSITTKKEYWLTRKQLDEFDDASFRMEDDAEFEKWFVDFVTKNHCPPRFEAPLAPSTYAPSSYGDWGGSSWSSGSGSLSSWWRSDVYGKWLVADDDERTLAKVMQIVRNTVRIVDDSDPPMSCNWAENSMSFTDLSGNEMHINPSPVTKMTAKDLSFEEACDICTGLAIHECGHSNGTYGTRTRHLGLTEPKPLMPLGVAGQLGNIIEDIRTENLTGEDFPGFVGYLTKTLEYTWNERSPEHNPTAWKTLADAMNALIIHLKWPEHSAEILTDPSFAAELPWWDNWLASYMTTKNDVEHGPEILRSAIQAALDRLGSDPERQKEMEEISERERFAREARDIESCIRTARMEKGTGKQLIADTCTNDVEDGETLDDETAARARQYVEEKLHEEEIRIGARGRSAPTVWVRKPIETPSSKESYIGKPGNIIERLKAALKFRPELARYWTRLQKSGEIDEEELWRWGGNDYRVFQNQNIEVYPKAQVALLVDMSGSMCSGIPINGTYEGKVMIAQRLAQLLVGALDTMEGVQPTVYGHTGDLTSQGDSGSADFMTIWEKGDPLTRLGLISSLDHGNNYDGYAISWVVDRVIEQSQPGDQRLVIVLSDGYPAGDGYGGAMAAEHVRQVTDDAERKETYVVQIAIDGAMRPEAQGKMFKHWVQFESPDKLPEQLARIVSKVLNAASE